MPALGWLINLDFAATASVAEVVATVEQNSGGYFDSWRWYDAEMVRRKKKKREQELAEERAQALQDKIDRELAAELRKAEKERERINELKRLAELAQKNIKQVEALEPRVLKALERAIVQGNYSAMEAFEREVSRAREEEEFLLLAWQILIGD